MSYSRDYPAFGMQDAAAHAEESARARFIRLTYTHLVGAVLMFVALEAALFALIPEATLDSLIVTVFSGWKMLLVLGGFMAVSYLAQYWASSVANKPLQYLGLLLYVVAEALIFVPLLWFATKFAPNTIPAAGVLTVLVFTGLTAVVFVTGADFSFLRTGLAIAGFAAMGVIICSMLFGWNILGVFFAAAMVVLASGYILYYTSNVMLHYRTDQYVAASLALFASVAMLFYYILRILMMFSRGGD